MEEAHWKGTEKIRRFLFMGFFSLLIVSIGFFIGMGDSLAGAKKRDKTAVSSISGGLAGKKETFHEFLSYRNVSYPSVYPNHFYDAYVYPSNRRGEVLGTIIYIHGGGFVSGTKDIAGENPYFLSWLRAGFQVISIDYALAPDYPYPTALHQISYCVEELLRLKESLGIDERKLIFMGDSA